MGRQDSYEDMDEPLLMRGQEYQVIMVGFMMLDYQQGPAHNSNSG